MLRIEVCDMRAAGKPGYVAKLGERREKQFLSASEYSSHGVSAKTISYLLKEDGIYEICDANYGARKRRIEFMLIRNGEVAFQSDSLQEVERKLSALEGKLEEWAVAPKEPLMSDRTITPAYPGLKTEPQPEEAVDAKISTCKVGETRFLKIEFQSDDAFKFFLPEVKRLPGRQWIAANKSWRVPISSALLLREMIEERTIRTNGIRKPLKFDLSSGAKEAMAMEE